MLHSLAVAGWNDGPDVVELRNSCSAAASVKPVCQNQNAEDALLGNDQLLNSNTFSPIESDFHVVRYESPLLQFPYTS